MFRHQTKENRVAYDHFDGYFDDEIPVTYIGVIIASMKKAFWKNIQDTKLFRMGDIEYCN